MLLFWKSRKYSIWHGKGMLFLLTCLRILTDWQNKSIPIGPEWYRRYAFHLKKPQIRHLERERYAFLTRYVSSLSP